MAKASIASLPIQFRRVKAGVYESTAVLSRGARDGEYRIYRTDHTGYGVSSEGRIRWHITYTPTDYKISWYQSRHYLSLESAIESLHRVIGQRLCDGFAVLAEMNAAAERKLEEARRTNEARATLKARIHSVVEPWRSHGSCNSDSCSSLVEMLTDALHSG